MPKAIDTETFVYVMARKNADGLSGPCKVGITSGLTDRLHQIRTASPFDVALASWFSLPTRAVAQEIEGAFHSVKKAHRLHGEWFDLEPNKATGMVLAGVSAFLQTRTNVAPGMVDEILNRILIDKENWAV